MYTQCPKCGHAPLPAQQAFPAACPACGVILAKVNAPVVPRVAEDDEEPLDRDEQPSRWLHVPEQVDPLLWAVRAALWVAFLAWGIVLIAQDVRTGELGSSFLHRPLLVFHEAGHVVFMPFGEWMTIAGGTFGQLLMPAIMGGALLWKNRDPFGASLGLWLLGVSLLDVAPYVYDALDPQLMLLGGRTGADGGNHDWVYLLSTLGLFKQAHGVGLLVHKLGALVILLALAWGGWVLRLQWSHRAQGVVRES